MTTTSPLQQELSTQLAQAECASTGYDYIQDHTADNTHPCNISIISWSFSNRTVWPSNGSKAITMSSNRVHNFMLLLWVKWDLCSSGILQSVQWNFYPSPSWLLKMGSIVCVERQYGITTLHSQNSKHLQKHCFRIMHRSVLGAV